METLQGSARVGNCSSGWGGSFPKKEGVGFAAGFAVVELTEVSPVPSPSVFES